MRALRSALVLLLTPLVAAAQPAPPPPGAWDAHVSFGDVRALTASADALWAGTDGGVFRYDPASGEIERYTTVQGLSGARVRAVTFDAERAALWIGYT
ncbi:MAG: regulator, partial [Rhodothermales bacterium]|nr:regulator [Rhodothermales bacterium]